MTWSGLTNFGGHNIWTDGTNIYYSNGADQYKLNGTTWESIRWSGRDPFGNCIWTDGTNIYYSSFSDQYKLNGTTWESMTWTGLTIFNGNCIWTDGTNTYYSDGADHYKLNGTAWETMTWEGLPGGLLATFDSSNIWTDNTNVYYSQHSTSKDYQYKLNGTTWEEITWTGISPIFGQDIWTDGTNVYYNDAYVGSTTYQLYGTTWSTTIQKDTGIGELHYKDIDYTDSGEEAESLTPEQLSNLESLLD